MFRLVLISGVYFDPSKGLLLGIEMYCRGNTIFQQTTHRKGNLNNMDKTRSTLKSLLFILIFTIIFTGCNTWPRTQPSGASRQIRFYRDLDNIDFSDISYTAWEAVAGGTSSEPQPVRPYTIMIYMNGSDLESDNGAGTADIFEEMLQSGVKLESANVILFTGGTYRWQNNAVPADTCMVWRINGDVLESVADVGLVNMGDAGTLASFISFSRKYFPSEKSALILWDHGGGSIAGFGHDENFNDSTLSLLEMNYAFEQSGLRNEKLEFLGIDACLMATVEMAVVAQPYAKYLVASQDLEPGDGWNYTFLRIFNDGAALDGVTEGKMITDYYMDFYGQGTLEDLSLSTTDLSRVDSVMGTMDKLMALCTSDLLRDREASFKTFAKKRDRTKAFGNSSPRDNGCDMVDIGDMAKRLSNLFPDEAALVLDALECAVIYNRHNSTTDLKGLSSYYIFAGKEYADESLTTYEGLGMGEGYTGYLRSFAGILTGEDFSRNRNPSSPDEYLSKKLTLLEPIMSRPDSYRIVGTRETTTAGAEGSWEKSGRWPSMGGNPIRLYEIDSSAKKNIYAVPASLNGIDVDIIVLVCDQYPNGKILGARQEDGYIIQKGLDDVKSGDKLSFYYEVVNFDDESGKEWVAGEEFTVEYELKLHWYYPDSDDNYWGSYLYTDVQENEHFTAPVPLKSYRSA